MVFSLFTDAVNLHADENAHKHRTHKYEVLYENPPSAMVVRRGQPFVGSIKVNRPYDDRFDTVQLIFTLGPATPHSVTRMSMFLRAKVNEDPYSWRPKLTSVVNDTVHFEVTSPVDLPVGAWSLQVVTWTRDIPLGNLYNFDRKIFILFNPWNPDDQTYMEDTDLLEEYVQNDVGKLWKCVQESNHDTQGASWVFGQFDSAVLRACVLVLDKAKIQYQDRGDPVKVTRTISRVVNSYDDGGVLVGKWHEPYTGGTLPSDWTGSVDILAEYLATGHEVRFGQCWVFAGVVTTICRALGIPTRAVSNVVSAHDANGTLSFDKYYTEDMEELSVDPTNPHNTDLLWNYHVWNDVWMARPDLPAGYGGWQAIDATPQEISMGLFQCGPAPLEAIKKGELGLNYDVAFMLATVNADYMRWRIDPSSEIGYSHVDTDRYHVGRMILTKKPFVYDPNGDMDRDNIIDQYKFREGTVSERIALMNGVRHSEKAKRYYKVAINSQSDVSFRLRDVETILIGKEFRIFVDIFNNCDEVRHIKATVIASSVYYNGVKGNEIHRETGPFFVGPRQREQLTMVVQPHEYLPKLVEYCNVKVSAMAFVTETKQAWADDEVFQIIKPAITIQCNNDLILGQPTLVTLSFPNPLDYPLTKCLYRLTSPAIEGHTILVKADDVEPNKMSVVTQLVTPNKLGRVHFVVRFSSDELRDISGAVTFDVFEA